MSSTGKCGSDLRLIVQYVYGDLDSPWHLVAYGGGRALRPRRFRSVEDLITVMRSTMPSFDPGHLVIEEDSRENYIAWTGDVVLTESQLSALGLKI